MDREHKSFPAIATKILDPDLGIVEHIVAVMGNIDLGQDVIHPGAFRKTIDERGLKVKVLDQHDTRSVEAVIGKPLELREMGRNELPPALVQQYPDATGALMAKTQFLLDTNRGREAFARIKAGAVDEYSIGYDPIVTDFGSIETPEGKQTVRNLRELRLWEYSPVIFGMNPATQRNPHQRRANRGGCSSVTANSRCTKSTKTASQLDRHWEHTTPGKKHKRKCVPCTPMSLKRWMARVQARKRRE